MLPQILYICIPIIFKNGITECDVQRLSEINAFEITKEETNIEIK